MEDAEVPAYVESLGLPGIIDLHVHFMPERVQAKVWAHFDRLVPVWPVTYRFGEDERLARLEALGVRHFTALAYAHRAGMAAWLNDHTLTLAEARSDVIPSFTIYPEPEAEAYVEDALARGGAVVKVHLQVGQFDVNDPLLDGVWALLARRRLPVVMHAGAVADGSGGEEYCGVDRVRRLLERFGDLALVIAHMGAPDYEDFVGLAAGAPGVRLDTTMAFGDSTLRAFPDQLLGSVERLGDRILFGSDFPTVPYTYAVQVERLAGLGMGDDWLRKVLWHNAAALLGFDDAGATSAGAGRARPELRPTAPPPAPPTTPHR